MDKIKIFIVEDNAAELQQIKEHLARMNYEICGYASHLEEAIEKAATAEADIYILDIYLNGTKGGISFAEKMNKGEINRRPFIFLTNAADRSTFDLARKTGPFSYLLKPFNELELQYAIELAIEKFEPLPLSAEDVFFVKTGNSLAKIQVGAIRHIEVDGKYCKLAYGKDKYFVQRSLKQLQEQLPSKQFVRVHRNYIVNLKEIASINLYDHEIILQDGHSLAFSRRYLDELTNKYNILK